MDPEAGRDRGATRERTLKLGRAESNFSNAITTAKYTLTNFLCYNLWEQFQNLANVYFLIMMILQTVKVISITNGKPTIAAPLTFVLCVGAAKDGIEDRKRHQQDTLENEGATQVWDSGSNKYVDKTWKEVRPGQLVRVTEGQRVPADIIFLDSSDRDANNVPVCYVETMDLDGETNLKAKSAPDLTPAGQGALEQLQEVTVTIEEPTADLYTFNGRLTFVNRRETALEHKNLLLRGTTLKQTTFVKGVVVYTGHETKVMKNSTQARFKQSELDLGMNLTMIFIFGLMLFLCFAGGLYYAFWNENADKTGSDSPQSFAYLFFKKGGQWALQMSNMVPISLLVTLTTVKYLQAQIIEKDEAIKDEVRKKHAEVHTSQVLESLGQVTHVFSDKTGTLTCNEMCYKMCYLPQLPTTFDPCRSQGNGRESKEKGVDFEDAAVALEAHLQPTYDPEVAKSVVNFFLCHALCHTVTKDKQGEYNASSPDELALVNAAKRMGLEFDIKGSIKFHKKYKNILEEHTKKAYGDATKVAGYFKYTELQVCEFDNDRKRMSVVVQIGQKQYLFVKGADTQMLPLIVKSKGNVDSKLSEFSKMGLRTLVLAFREFGSSNDKDWAQRWEAARKSTGKDKEKKIAELSKEIEDKGGLQLLGVTAVEDKLQDKVPVVIEKLRHAGIVVWVLTGDKMETAIEIGKACNLLTGLENLTVESKDELDRALKLAMDKTKGGKNAVTITGDALKTVLHDDKLRTKFYQLCLKCGSVLACRVSPKQKADVVRMVQELYPQFSEGGRHKAVTLSIGDGANDVNMITTADIGVGIAGKEGAQAARTADFAIGQFECLDRLLFYYGTQCYRRNAVLTNYSFYKNILLVMPPYIFGNFIYFTDTPFYEQLLYQLYNVVFTFLPIMVFAVLDDAFGPYYYAEHNPPATSYKDGQDKKYYNPFRFGVWFCTAVAQAILIITIAHLNYSQEVPGFDFAYNNCTYANNSLQCGPPKTGLAYPTSNYIPKYLGAACFAWVILGANVTLAPLFTWAHKERWLYSLMMFVALVGSVLMFPITVFGLQAAHDHALDGIPTFIFSQSFLLWSLVFLVGHASASSVLQWYYWGKENKVCPDDSPCSSEECSLCSSSSAGNTDQECAGLLCSHSNHDHDSAHD